MLWTTLLFVIAHASAQDEKLVLTDYIVAGNVTGAKLASKVTSDDLLASQLESYSGFFRISSDPFRHLFFWFFPCEYEPANKPLLLWLQGGPGQSAMIGIMEEFGPLVLNEDGSAVRYNPNSWTQDLNILFLDSPIGTGFSFSNSSANGTFATNVDDVAQHLFAALLQFFAVFAEYRTNAFYIAGESYAGKYVPTLAYIIEQYNSQPTTTGLINLQDLIIVSGLIDPTYQLKLGLVLKQWGFVNSLRSDLYLEGEELAVASLIARGENLEADNRWFESLGLALMVMNYASLYNAQDDMYPTLGAWPEFFVTKANIKEALHVGTAFYSPHDDSEVRDHMVADFMNSALSKVQAVLLNRKVLLINGNMDLMVAPALNEQMLAYLEPTYIEAARSLFKVDNKTEGYIKKGGNVVSAVLRNCGHYVPRDCSRTSRMVVSQFLAGTL